MGIADRIAEERQKLTMSRCRFGRLEDELGADDWALLLKLVDEVRAVRGGAEKRNQTNGLSAAAISRALRAEGHNISVDVVQHHAYQHCRCGF